VSTEIGRQAEATAADWLRVRGFKILARNWRNRFCEIDIVAEKAGTIHVVEVKFRKTADFGSGLEYITADKQRRLERAAESWAVENGRMSDHHQVDVVSVTGFGNSQTLEYLPNALGD
jgi:putative endonuclease